MVQTFKFDLITIGLREKYSKTALKVAYRILQDKYNAMFNESLTLDKVTTTSPISNYVYAPNGFNGTLTTIFYKNGFDSFGRGIGTDLDNDIIAGNVEVFDKTNVWQPAVDPINGAGFSANAFNTPLNRSNIWFNSTGDVGPYNFDLQIFAECEKDVYVGIGGDNTYKVTLNSVDIIDNGPAIVADPYYASLLYGYSIPTDTYHQFLLWNLYPIRLQKGLNILGLSVLNPDGPGNPGLMGLEVYDDSIENIRNATLDPAFIADPINYPYTNNYYLGLNMIFSSRFIYQSDSLLASQELVFENIGPYDCLSSTDNLVVAARNISKRSNITEKYLRRALQFLIIKIKGCC